MNRKQTSPGEILKEEYLIPLKLTQRELANHIGCDIKVINRIVNGRSRLTPKIAIKLSKEFKTSPEFWLNAQIAVDINNEQHLINNKKQCKIKKKETYE